MTHNEQEKETLFVGLSAGTLRYQACVVRICGNKRSVLKAYSVPRDETDWHAFVKTIEQDFPDHLLTTAMGFDDGCVGFYRFEMPLVDEKQMLSVVASQAEIHLPLPIEQMHYGWQISKKDEVKQTVVVAAAKRDMLSVAVNQARQANVEAIILSSEAVLRAVLFLCEDLPKEFNLLRIGEDGVRLFFSRNEMLAKVTKFDCDFSTITDGQLPEASLLCLDIQNVIAEYAANNGCRPPLFLEGSGAFVETVRALLTEKGVETRRIQYDFGRISSEDRLAIDRECLGLALIAQDALRHYDLFKGLYHKQKTGPKERTGGRTKILIAAVCLMGVIFIAVSYGIDRFRLAVYEKGMNTPEFSRLLETHRLRTEIARQRIDIPELIEKINQGLPAGVSVGSLSVRRFQKIVVGGSCQDPKRMYDFAEALGKCNGIEGVRVSNHEFDEKKRQTTFTLTFDYKNFTDKRKAVQ